LPEGLDLDEARTLLGLTESQVLARLGAGEDDVQRDVGYEGLEGLSVVHRPEAFAGRVYLRDGTPELVYFSAPEGVTGSGLDAELGGTGAELRSRAGKMFNHHVHAEQGVAYSADGDEVAFVEVFAPRPLADYERDIYRDPGPFVR
jgi:hypothetical protein